jgi:hypothetical protein
LNPKARALALWACRPQFEDQIVTGFANERLSCGVAKGAQVVFDKHPAIGRRGLKLCKGSNERMFVMDVFDDLQMVLVFRAHHQMVLWELGVLGKAHQFGQTVDGSVQALSRAVRDAGHFQFA